MPGNDKKRRGQLGNAADLDLKSDLARRGRDSGQIYLVDGDGTLVFVTFSLEEAKDSSAYRNSGLVPEIWVRTPSGEYVRAAASAHYERTRSGEVIYWDQSTRDFLAFSIADRKTRKAPDDKVPSYEDVVNGISLSSDRKGLQFGVKVEGRWKYQPLDLEPDGLR